MSGEQKFNSRKAVRRVGLQLSLLVVVVFGWAYWLNNHNDVDTSNDENLLEDSTRLPIDDEARTSCSAATLAVRIIGEHSHSNKCVILWVE